MGLGGALFEAISFEDGQDPQPALLRLPRAALRATCRRSKTVLLDRKDLPSAGAGETPIIGVAPAVGNAIFAATGHPPAVAADGARRVQGELRSGAWQWFFGCYGLKSDKSVGGSSPRAWGCRPIRPTLRQRRRKSRVIKEVLGVGLAAPLASGLDEGHLLEHLAQHAQQRPCGLLFSALDICLANSAAFLISRVALLPAHAPVRPAGSPSEARSAPAPSPATPPAPCPRCARG